MKSSLLKLVPVLAALAACNTTPSGSSLKDAADPAATSGTGWMSTAAFDCSKIDDNQVSCGFADAQTGKVYNIATDDAALGGLLLDFSRHSPEAAAQVPGILPQYIPTNYKIMAKVAGAPHDSDGSYDFGGIAFSSTYPDDHPNQASVVWEAGSDILFKYKEYDEGSSQYVTRMFAAAVSDDDTTQQYLYWYSWERDSGLLLATVSSSLAAKQVADGSPLMASVDDERAYVAATSENNGAGGSGSGGGGSLYGNLGETAIFVALFGI